MELNLNLLLSKLIDNPEEILRKIDEDPLLKKREYQDLVIANASSKLFTPIEEHQLYAKGIVYTRDPYTVVSLPLIKIYNWGESGEARYLGAELLAAGAEMRRALKLDGSMIQVFHHNDKVHLATRGVIRGDHTEIDGFNIWDRAWEALNSCFTGVGIGESGYEMRRDFKHALQSGKTFVFEFVSPDNQIITPYSEDHLVLLAVTDWKNGRYERPDRYTKHGRYGRFAAAGCFQSGMLSSNIEEAISQTEEMMTDSFKSLQEGVVIEFVLDDAIVHRAKLKTEAWRAIHRLKYQTSYADVVNWFRTHPDCSSWEQYASILKSEGGIDEEVVDLHKPLVDRYLDWWMRADLLKCSCNDFVLNWQNDNKHLMEEMHENVYMKAFALDDFVSSHPHKKLLFHAMRKEYLTMEDMFQMYSPLKEG